MYRNRPPTIHLKDYRPPEFLIDRVELRFELAAETTRVEASLEMRRNPAAVRGDGDLRLDGEQLELEQVALDGRPLPPAEYRIEPEALILHHVPDRFRLETRVRIHPQRNTALEGLYQSGALLCTQCEAEGFRRITYFLDRPDVMARYTTTLVADKGRYPVLLANGNPAGTEDLGGGRHLARWEDPFPKPCYLFALVAGDLHEVADRFTTASGREVALRLYVEPENHDKCDHAMRSLKQAMRWDEERYGREYDLEVYLIVAVSHFNMGAMENKGLNVFNAKYVLARPDTATDQDFLGIEAVIAHEYFHNWTGNRITCRDWFQLSLKEGFTVFRDQEFSADMGARDVKRIADVRTLRARQFPEDAGPLAHPVRPDAYIEINNFYTATVYEKGAELVRMQARLLGPEAFRRATDLYFARHDGQAVTIEDFVRCMEEASGRDLTQFMRWYAQAGTPELTVTDTWDAAGGVYTLTFRQRTVPRANRASLGPLHIPVAVGLLDADGRDLPLRTADDTAEPPSGTRLLELRRDETSYRFVGLRARPVPSLLRGFSAPVKVRYDYSDDDLLFLMAHDSDGFNRWDAAQTLAQRLLLRRVAEPEAQVPAGFIAAFRRALTDADADPALRAEVLTLPSEAHLGEQMAVVDVDGIHRAREGLRHAILAALRSELRAVYEAHRDPGPYASTPAAIGRRALKNLALGYLMQDGDQEAVDLCAAQFDAGANMTDVIAALGLLVDVGGAPAERALDTFYRRWAADPLVLDKWFAVQAASKRPDTLARVEALLGHEAFTLRNPNRLRSLVGVFCSLNPVRFHAADGAGYRFLGDRVLELDPLNPQIASRMLQALARWRRYDPARQALMRAQLERIVAVEELSKDVYEVASKTLGERPA
ncbi:aminopeptidase N [Thiococcus pfennigii]|uniref:aminopeptidase N n=1 Tax=Thiococcus pfennigii TaxID=1057 RepID=UPI001903C5E0|nr:aminopeptidase N [Thiococcus pfennigii]MBK1702352.1 aminopeptidase N [Thiococcus pfennigii]MBK1732583.1 aminopeptidase N [Thiococcus pfennigii]